MTAFSIKLSSEANKLVHFVSKRKKDEKCSLLGVSNLWQKNQRNDNLQVCLSSLLSLIWGTGIRRKFSFSSAMMLDDGCTLLGNPGLLPWSKKYNLTSSGDFKPCGSSSLVLQPLKKPPNWEMYWFQLTAYKDTFLYTALYWGSEDRNGVLRMRKEIKC